MSGRALVFALIFLLVVLMIVSGIFELVTSFGGS